MNDVVENKKNKNKRAYLSGRPKFEWYLIKPNYWLVWLGLGLMWVLVQLPYVLHLWIAKNLGKLGMVLAKERRHIAEVNLKLCFPEMSEADRKALLEKNFQSAVMALFEMGIAWWWPKWRFKNLYKIQGLEHLEKLHAQGRGVILTSCHFTNLDIGGAVAHYFPTDALFRMHKNHAFDYVQTRGRCSNNPDTQFIARQNVKDMIKSLRAGRVVWYAPDQDFGRKNSVFVNLFGVPAATITSTSRLAKLGKAVVVPMTQKRLEDGSGYLVTIHPPVEGFPAKNDQEDAQLLIELVEKSIKEAPDQYMWMHRRFKTRPEGEKGVY
jgi:Kdo2-lipid IVA lauroyltransferase/acyltransferase